MDSWLVAARGNRKQIKMRGHSSRDPDSARKAVALELVKALTIPAQGRVSPEEIARLCYNWSRLKQSAEQPPTQIIFDASKSARLRQRT